MFCSYSGNGRTNIQVRRRQIKTIEFVHAQRKNGIGLRTNVLAAGRSKVEQTACVCADELVNKRDRIGWVIRTFAGIVAIGRDGTNGEKHGFTSDEVLGVGATKE